MKRGQIVSTVQDCSQLERGILVFCELQNAAFGITCRLGENPYVAFLNGNAIEGVHSPILVEYEQNGLSFGSDFSVGFDAREISLDSTPNLGDLIIRQDKLWIAAHRRESPGHAGGRCIVCLDNGDVANSWPKGAIVKRWSIAVATEHNGELCTIFERP